MRESCCVVVQVHECESQCMCVGTYVRVSMWNIYESVSVRECES